MKDYIYDSVKILLWYIKNIITKKKRQLNNCKLKYFLIYIIIVELLNFLYVIILNFVKISHVKENFVKVSIRVC